MCLFLRSNFQKMSSLGRHILVEYYDCNPDKINDVPHIEKSMIDAAVKAGATIINSNFHHFSPFGVSGVVVIEESHLAIHTWPEYGYAAVDIFTCGESVDPWIAYEFMKNAFEADNGSAIETKRGQKDLLDKKSWKPTNAIEQADTPKNSRNIWFTERDQNTAFSLRHKGDLLYKGQSDFQKVEVYDTFAFGRLLTLDGMIMCTEKDEFGYHEMITHVPTLSHGKMKRALVIGGGDGGTVRELLRHENFDEVVMVEIDGMVVDASRKFLPSLSNALDHPKLTLLIEDGIKYVKESPAESFDLVIVDSTDPIGPAEGLFSIDFYQHVHRILTPNGISVSQCESPYYNAEVNEALFSCFHNIFGKEKVWKYLAFIPTYPTGMWSFSFSSKGNIQPSDFNAELAQQFTQKHNLQYYNAEIHKAAFALPSFCR